MNLCKVSAWDLYRWHCLWRGKHSILRSTLLCVQCIHVVLCWCLVFGVLCQQTVLLTVYC